MGPFALGFEFPAIAASALFDSFVAMGFESDAPLRYYLGLWRDRPVATSLAFFGEGVGGTFATTVPEARRHGVGALMTLAALRDARATGYQIAVTQASDLGRGIHLRLGFKEYCRLGMYVLEGGGPPAKTSK